MPATTLLPIAGPAGTIIAMVLGACIVAVIGINFCYMALRYPDSGGAFTYTKKLFGYDHAFLCAWSLVLAYLSILWANATAFILIGRFLLGPVFQVGFHYQIAGFDVYFGEIILTIVILAVFGLITAHFKKLAINLNTVFALVMVIGTVVIFCAVSANLGGYEGSFKPAFQTGEHPVIQVFNIVALAPWAYLGFESITHATGECKFPTKRLMPIMLVAVVCSALVYVLTTLISVLGMPQQYASWAAYLANLGSYDGLEGLPTFHAAHSALGQVGISILAAAVLGALSTSLIGLYRASSRLLYCMAEDDMLPSFLRKLSDDGVPRNAVLTIMLVSFLVPFVGRAAIGWIVDVTSISAAIAYGYASACSLVTARREGSLPILATSVIGIIAAVAFIVFPLVPNLWSMSSLAPASYLILAAWSVLGLAFFRAVFQRDREHRFGHSTIVWIAMLFLIFFASTMWMRMATNDSTEDVVTDVSTYYVKEYTDMGVQVKGDDIRREEAFLQEETSQIRDALMDNSLVQMVLIIVSLIIMFSIYSLMIKREKEINLQRLEAQQSSKAKTTFLSNMSHDIRTPMNAIIGYTHLARREGASPEEVQEYLGKIDDSSKHLLALINDVLEMSRIESGKMELDFVETDLVKTMDEVRDMFATQMSEKKVDFTVDASGVSDAFVLCDKNRLNRVLLNLLSNAYKFTPEGGAVSVVLKQLGVSEEARRQDAAEAPESQDASAGAPIRKGRYELRVKDSGIGMTAEFAKNVFDAFERERTSTVSGIQGTGLGMAITKSIVDLMGGTIAVQTEQGKGTEFIVNVSFELVERAEAPAADADAGEHAVDFTGMRILLVEDNEINREIASLILEDAGFEIEEAENGQIALDKVSSSQPGDYDAVLMDVQMPVMDGYEATRAIRALDDERLAGIPIIAASANAFEEDVQASKDAGMNAHISKPLDVDKVMQVLAEVLG